MMEKTEAARSREPEGNRTAEDKNGGRAPSSWTSAWPSDQSPSHSLSAATEPQPQKQSLFKNPELPVKREVTV